MSRLNPGDIYYEVHGPVLHEILSMADALQKNNQADSQVMGFLTDAPREAVYEHTISGLSQTDAIDSRLLDLPKSNVEALFRLSAAEALMPVTLLSGNLSRFTFFNVLHRLIATKENAHDEKDFTNAWLNVKPLTSTQSYVIEKYDFPLEDDTSLRVRFCMVTGAAACAREVAIEYSKGITEVLRITEFNDYVDPSALQKELDVMHEFKMENDELSKDIEGLIQRSKREDIRRSTQELFAKLLFGPDKTNERTPEVIENEMRASFENPFDRLVIERIIDNIRLTVEGYDRALSLERLFPDLDLPSPYVLKTTVPFLLLLHNPGNSIRM
ncbi:hypothetical protein IPL85_04735 [Candidatus Saccharibacteria bacterium]|nr:MAG: hypothetical protein IPL85_04735 [Candidatus Saccharibacteria bacterium]